ADAPDLPPFVTALLSSNVCIHDFLRYCTPTYTRLPNLTISSSDAQLAGVRLKPKAGLAQL
ncbi:MAG: hypothetical protein ACK55Z_01485, partial [bacterium]